MPELPEVETIVCELREKIVGATLQALNAFDTTVWHDSSMGHRSLLNQKLTAIERRGKYIVYRFEAGALIQHLRMTGKMLPIESEKIPKSFLDPIGSNLQIRFSIEFSENQKYVFYDIRRLGTLSCVPDSEAYFDQRKLAPEIFSDDSGEAARKHFVSKLRSTNRAIKSALLDQTVVAGVGNIYADEALHRTRLHPATRSRTLTSRIANELFDNLTAVMLEAINKRGTSMSDYLDVNGNPGLFRKYLHVYRREGESCRTCNTGKIEKIKVSGRSSHFCPVCQRKRRRKS